MGNIAMKLQICTREEAENLAGRHDWAVIDMAPEVSLESGWHAVHCVNPGDEMSQDEAFAIVKFMRRHALKVNGFLVVGDHGIGRTQGVAAWLAECFNIPQFSLANPDAEFALDPRFNKYVFEMLRNKDRYD